MSRIFRSSTPAVTSTPAPPPSTSRSAGRVGWAGLNRLLEVLGKSTGVCAPLKEIVEELVELIDVFERVGDGSEEYQTLQNQLEDLFLDLSQYLSGSVSQTMTTCMENLCHGIKKELNDIKSKHLKRQRGPDGRRRNMGAGDNSEAVLACYRRIQSYLQRLALNADLSMWKLIDEHVADARLDRLTPVMASLYDSDESLEVKRGPCTEGTRVEVLANMHSWVYTSQPGAVYWLNGMAGTGKTTIAYSLCEGLETARRLGASFFCTRMLPKCREVNRIIPSIAYQLARFSRPFLCALLRVLDKDRDIHKRALRKQFETLIVNPLAEVQNTLPTDLVVVIDALDECDNKDSTRHILDLLLTKAWMLPIKFFVCSRPEPQIRDEMMLQGGMRASARLVLHELDRGIVEADIGIYLRDALRPMQPSGRQLAGLVGRAGVLFIYAATAVRYIGYDNFSRDPHGRLEAILNVSIKEESKKDEEIDELYTMILEAAIEDPGLDRREKEEMRLVLNTVVCAREPLTIGALAGLLNLNLPRPKRVHSALRPLWSVLHIMEASEIVTTLHASFPDYMFDSKRSKEYYCDSNMHHSTLARLCFDCIENTQPQFNICGLDSSCVLDKQVKDIDDRVQRAISTELFYACRYWMVHLEYAELAPDLVEKLEAFLSKRLFLWMEVLSLKKCIHTGARIMWRAENWSRRQGCSEEILLLAYDAWRYVIHIASSPISQSTPHIYVSMLPFWPPSAPITKHYLKRTQGLIVPRGTAMTNRQPSKALASWSFAEKIQSAAFSPDDCQIALAAGINVHLLDVFTGQAVAAPFVGHTGAVSSVAFSPDGSCIVSGSHDETIRTWDTQSGRPIIDPLRGHADIVTCVRFSFNGARIVSGSQDNTIRVWDAQSGETLLGPLQGHKTCITAVGFSPDGTRIVSSSLDNTILIWDTRNSTAVELEGHIGPVTSVVFSPNGRFIASGSRSFDSSLGLWNAHNGKKVDVRFKWATRVTCIAFSSDSSRIVTGAENGYSYAWDPTNGVLMLGPLNRSSNAINSIAFSELGSHLVSASNDGTITLWDAKSNHSNLSLPSSTPIVSRPDDNPSRAQGSQSKEAVHDGLKGHTDSVSSVTFSPDGTRIASGCAGCTIRTQSWQMAFPQLGPADKVTLVRFSPDGTRIVTGSADWTIRVWDRQDGQPVLGPFIGHSNRVTSVGFSPDGTRIVSGSDDKTIRVWDMQSGQTVLGPLEGHTMVVNSVAFSPDGTRIVSGSFDATIRVWDAHSGQTVLSPLNGHADSVEWVEFSPDGTLIVSGSFDSTIRVWDSQSGQTVLGPLVGHMDRVTSARFSPDGTHVVSGSYDRTIRVWDLQSGATVFTQLNAHADRVTSVRFLPDGTSVVSRSHDHTMRMWSHPHTTRRSLQMTMVTSPIHSFKPQFYTMNKDGWLVDDDSQLLIWIPQDLRDALPPPVALRQILPPAPFWLDFDGALLGKSWTRCYLPK